jgi:hypothetical protein
VFLLSSVTVSISVFDTDGVGSNPASTTVAKYKTFIMEQIQQWRKLDGTRIKRPNPGFKSNDALKEAMGYILGMGFAFKAKPNAFASSNCANKIVQ